MDVKIHQWLKTYNEICEIFIREHFTIDDVSVMLERIKESIGFQPYTATENDVAMHGDCRSRFLTEQN